MRGAYIDHPRWGFAPKNQASPELVARLPFREVDAVSLIDDDGSTRSRDAAFAAAGAFLSPIVSTAGMTRCRRALSPALTRTAERAMARPRLIQNLTNKPPGL